MAGSSHATLDAVSRGRPRRRSAGAVRAAWPLAAVAAAFTLAQLLLVRPGMGLGWDETVYVSQVGRHAPASFFSAPRARGVSLLVAPVASWSSSTPLLRVYLALLSGLALFLALRAWRGLFPIPVLALAGGLFASLWTTLFYGPQAMPNLWVAVGALAAVACFLRTGADRADRAAPWGLAASTALMACMRPVDAVWVCLPLLVPGLRRGRRRALLVLLAGLAVGAAEWVIEAYTGYGGLARRLADGSAIQGGLGWHLAVVDQLRALGGRTLCRPCAGALPHPLLTLWWFALLPLAGLALAVAVRARRTTATALPLACAATAAFPYLFLIGYAAPRFLLPAYALLAIPVADALAAALTTRHPVIRPASRTAWYATRSRGAGPAPDPAGRTARFRAPGPARSRLSWPTRGAPPASGGSGSPDAVPDVPPAPDRSGAPGAARGVLPASDRSGAPGAAPDVPPAPGRNGAPCAAPGAVRRRSRQPGPARRTAVRPGVLVLVCAGLAVHLGAQLGVLGRVVTGATGAHRAWARTATELNRRGVRPPCLVAGHEALPVAYAAGCASAATSGPNADSTPEGIARAARRMPVATLVPAGSAPPGYARDWPSTAVGAVRLYYVVPGAGA